MKGISGSLVLCSLCVAGMASADPDPLTPSTLQSDLTTPDSSFAGSRDISELSIEDLLGRTQSKIRFNIDFFGDLSATASSEPGSHPGMRIGEPSILITADLGSGFQSLMEYAHGTADSTVDVERLNIGWQNETFSITAGRIHNPIGYWNPRYHHGHWLMPTIDRPRILAFEDQGGLYPVHQVGLFGSWQTKIGDGQIHIDAGVANGRATYASGTAALSVAVDGDNNLAKSYVLAAYIHDVGLPGLRLGAGFVIDKIAPQPAAVRPALPDTAITELIGNLNVAYQSTNVLVIAEGYALSHQGGSSSTSFLHGYALFGYRLGVMTPYVREEIFAPKGGLDPFYTPDPMAADAVTLYGFSETIAGVRYNLSSWCALKGEYRLELPFDSARSAVHLGIVNWSFGI